MIKHFLVFDRRAEVVAPGVIVSTIVEETAARTVVFARDRRARRGFSTEVIWHDWHAGDRDWRAVHDGVAKVAQAEAIARTSAPRPHAARAVAR